MMPVDKEVYRQSMTGWPFCLSLFHSPIWLANTIFFSIYQNINYSPALSALLNYGTSSCNGNEHITKDYKLKLFAYGNEEFAKADDRMAVAAGWLAV